MHDYMICIDENGSPYLAHALFGNRKGGQKKDHKWYARENVKGSWRYWYDPESYRKWASGAINKVKSTANSVKATGNAYRELKQAKKAQTEAANEYWEKHPKMKEARSIGYYYGLDKYGRAVKKTDQAREKLKKSSSVGNALVETSDKINNGIVNLLDGTTFRNTKSTIGYNAHKTMQQVERFLNSFDEPSEIRSAKKTVKSAKKSFDKQMRKVFGKDYKRFQKSAKKTLRDIDKFFYENPVFKIE